MQDNHLTQFFASDKVRHRNWRWVSIFSARQRSLSCDWEQLQRAVWPIPISPIPIASGYSSSSPVSFSVFEIPSLVYSWPAHGVNSKRESQSWFAHRLPTNLKSTRWEDKILNPETQRSCKSDIHRALQIQQSRGMLMGESIQMKCKSMIPTVILTCP